MKLTTLIRPVVLFVGLLAVAVVLADDAQQLSPKAVPETAVRAVLDDYVAAFNRRDAAALGAKWKEQGVFVNESTGERTVGRAEIQGNFVALFAEQADLTLGGQVNAIRFIRPDVAEVTGQAVTIRPGEEPNDSTFTAILVRDGKKWLFDSIHETLVPPSENPYDQLQALEFLVGRWVDDSADAHVDSTIRWGANRTFLVRAYTIDRGDGEVQQGTQIIGWDPRQQRIRCWMFDSDGSFGDGTWTPSADGWTVKITQTLANGSTAGATQVITNVDQNTLVVQLVGREVDGEMLPSAEPVRVVRVSEQVHEQPRLSRPSDEESSDAQTN